MTSKDLRRKYIEFYKSKNHAEIPSASLLPENDPSVLFTTAGMSPLVPFLLGEKHPAGARLVNSQKCIRTGDIDEVGDKTHHTFFEMLGHWSLGDYFKKEALEMSFEFVTKELGLDKKFLAVSVFEGDKNAPADNEAIETWKNLGIAEKRIKPLSKNSNWWEPAGNSGPCGPCAEMFYWTGDKNSVPAVFDPADKNWVEIGNDVLMEYEKVGENKYKIAKQKNIDNGTGLERLLASINGLNDNYRTDLFWPIIQKIEELSGKTYDLTPDPLLVKERGTSDTARSMRIIADHLRAATFIMGDEHGVGPSNVDQGYVVRKLIRRAIRHGKLIGIDKNFCAEIAEIIINLMKDAYSELEKNKEFVISNIKEEEERFRKTIEIGMKEFEKVFSRFVKETGKRDYMNLDVIDLTNLDRVNCVISGKEAFDLYSSYGLPIEIITDLCEQKGIFVDEKSFEEEMRKHQDLSRTASAGKFKGGLANQSEMAIKYHTATHLTLAALRKVLGEHVFQRGSNITDERMRLDFSHGEKMTAEQIKEVEDIVNEQIQKNLPVECEETTVDEAKESGAVGIFENKYGDRVKVYSVGADDVFFSKEICGGPHVKNTGELGIFKILKEEASSAGVRRIKAVLS